SYQSFTREILHNTVSKIIPSIKQNQTTNNNNSTPILTNQVAGPIKQRTPTFNNNETDSPSIQIIEEDQETQPYINSNLAYDMPRVSIENCNNCKVEIKFTFQK
ncbi:2642_t:CDS:2, partial [Dentiscutata heterogama]